MSNKQKQNKMKVIKLKNQNFYLKSKVRTAFTHNKKEAILLTQQEAETISNRINNEGGWSKFEVEIVK